MVAQNALVQVDFPSQLELVKVYGFPSETKGNTVLVRFNDIYADDEKGILIKFKSRLPVKEKIAFSCKMKYTNAKDFEQVTAEKQLTVDPATDTTAINQSKNVLVDEMIALYESTEAFEEILTDVDDGNYDRAKIKADAAIQVLRAKQKYLPSEKLKKQEENLSSYSKEMEHVKAMRETEKKIYQKLNKSANYSIKKGKE